MIPPCADCRTFEYLVAYFETGYDEYGRRPTLFVEGHGKYERIPTLQTFVVTAIGERKAEDWESFIKEQKKNGRDIIAISNLGERE
jgi:hypothetical protein